MALHTLLNVVYVLIAIAMIVFILLQRGAGAQAGSGFGAGASGTVFGSRGSANFLSSSTKWLAVVFFGLSLFMAWQASHSAKPAAEGPAKPDLGLMAELPSAPATKSPPATPVPAATQTTPIIAPAPTQAPAPAAEQPADAAEGSKGG
jgi:preprotein translocase subunit SecG